LGRPWTIPERADWERVLDLDGVEDRDSLTPFLELARRRPHLPAAATAPSDTEPVAPYDSLEMTKLEGSVPRRRLPFIRSQFRRAG
jgi:hypothetical protein